MEQETSWLERMKQSAVARWERFWAKPTLGKVISVLLTAIVLYLAYRMVRWIFGWRVVQTYVVTPISGIISSLGLDRFGRKVE